MWTRADINQIRVSVSAVQVCLAHETLECGVSVLAQIERSASDTLLIIACIRALGLAAHRHAHVVVHRRDLERVLDKVVERIANKQRVLFANNDKVGMAGSVWQGQRGPLAVQEDLAVAHQWARERRLEQTQACALVHRDADLLSNKNRVVCFVFNGRHIQVVFVAGLDELIKKRGFKINFRIWKVGMRIILKKGLFNCVLAWLTRFWSSFCKDTWNMSLALNEIFIWKNKLNSNQFSNDCLNLKYSCTTGFPAESTMFNLNSSLMTASSTSRYREATLAESYVWVISLF